MLSKTGQEQFQVYFYVFLGCYWKFFYVLASGGLYFLIYITIHSPLIIIFVHWTQLLEYWSHDTNYVLWNYIYADDNFWWKDSRDCNAQSKNYRPEPVVGGLLNGWMGG